MMAETIVIDEELQPDKPENHDPIITASMAKQEEAFEKAAARKAAKADKNVKAISAQEESARVARLKFLIEKSKVYTSILADKLSKQQEKSRSRGQEIDKGKTDTTLMDSKKGNYDISKYVDPDDLLKNSNGTSTAAALKEAASKHRPSTRGTKQQPEEEVKEEEEDDTANTEPSRSARQPELVTGGVLRDYQLAGVEWMVSLYENGLNGILADEMGLGKTLQTIGFLAHLRSKGVMGPFLIAAPLSTIANWVNEVKRFTPDIPVLLYHGTKDERAELRNKFLGRVNEKFPIVVTSYEIVMNDRKFLQKYSWKYIVVDEGHRLKNLNCRLIRELKAYTSANRLLLTGTPLQNNLSELWSLLNFLLPDIFSDLESFQSWFDFSSLESSKGGNLVDEAQQTSVVAQLHQILKPFLLRRLKTDVEKNLPKKREYLLYAPMTVAQTGLYKAILGKQVEKYYSEQSRETQSGRKKTSEKLGDKKRPAETDADGDEDGEGEGRRKSKRARTDTSMRELTDTEWFKHMKTQEKFPDLPKTETAPASTPNATTSHLNLRNMLMSLRKACNHPYQMNWPVYPGTDEYIVDETLVNKSGKMLLLQRLLDALFARDHKVLIFSQFTHMLDIIQVWAEDIMNLNVSRIDGSIDQESRRSQISDFNVEPDHKLFLLSTRAGGLGINLVSADTVILFDSDWNPQSDLQAMDRVHRIGQKRPVIVYRLVSANTIESKILERATSKRRLEKVVIQKDQFKSIVSEAEAGGAASGGGGGAMAMAQLSEILMSEDAETIPVKSEQDEIISDADLEKILDRSESAYEVAADGEEGDAASGGGGSGGPVFKSIKTVRDADNDALAS